MTLGKLVCIYIYIYIYYYWAHSSTLLSLLNFYGVEDREKFDI